MQNASPAPQSIEPLLHNRPYRYEYQIPFLCSTKFLSSAVPNSFPLQCQIPFLVPTSFPLQSAHWQQRCTENCVVRLLAPPARVQYTKTEIYFQMSLRCQAAVLSHEHTERTHRQMTSGMLGRQAKEDVIKYVTEEVDRVKSLFEGKERRLAADRDAALKAQRAAEGAAGEAATRAETAAAAATAQMEGQLAALRTDLAVRPALHPAPCATLRRGNPRTQCNPLPASQLKPPSGHIIVVAQAGALRRPDRGQVVYSPADS